MSVNPPTDNLSTPNTLAPEATTETPPVAPGNGAPDSVATPPTASGNTVPVLYCANHPETETLLRCNRCEKPICLKCAVLTDVGYRCKECIRGVQASYFNAIPADNFIGFGVAMLVSAIGSPIAGFILAFVPFFFAIIIAFAIGSAAGGALAQIIRTSVGRRRGRYLRHFTLAGIIIGVLIGGVIGAFFGIPVFSLATLAFTILASATAYQILR